MFLERSMSENFLIVPVDNMKDLLQDMDCTIMVNTGIENFLFSLAFAEWCKISEVKTSCAN